MGRNGVRVLFSWSIDVANQIDAIRDTDKLWMLPPVPSGYVDHLQRSFEMARKGE